MVDPAEPGSGSRIRLIRAGLGLSQVEFAAMIGVSNVTVNRWEHDRAKPERSTFDRILRAGRDGVLALTGPANRGNLPVPSGQFFGRTEELQRLKTGLEVSSLVTLIGTGGSGKSRLAIEYASGALSDYRDGTWWVDLTPVTTPDDVAETVGRVLGVRESGGQSLVEHIAAFCENRHGLLILDNCEHLRAACAQLVTAVASKATSTKLIATSRRPLDLGFELLFPVNPLPTDPDKEHRQEERSPAADLFIDRARRLTGNRNLSEAEIRDIDVICRRLDGLPLAIEIAAARTSALSPGQISDLLDDHLKWPIGLNPTRGERGSSLEATLAWSYDLLSIPDQSLFRRLGVFPGDFDLDEAFAILSSTTSPDQPLEDDSMLRASILAGIERLVECSLVFVDFESESQARYRMLETLRVYARERLDACGEVGWVNDRRRVYFTGVAAELHRDLDGPGQTSAFRRFESVNDNFRASLGWALSSADADAALSLTASLWRLWQSRGQLREGKRWIESTLALQPVDVSAPLAESQTGLASISIRLGDHATATKALAEAREGWMLLGDRRGLSRIDYLTGHLALRSGDHPEARRAIESGLAVSRDLDDTAGSANGLNLLGQVESALGNEALAERRFAESWSLIHRLGDVQTESVVLANLGEVLRRQGRPREAVGYLERSLALSRQIGHDEGVAVKLMNLAEVRLDAGDSAKAIALATESVERCRELGFRGLIADSLYVKGVILLLTGDRTDGASTLREALALYHMLGNQTDAAAVLEALAMLVHGAGDSEAAARWMGAAAAMRALEGAEPYAPTRYRGWLHSIRRSSSSDRFRTQWEAGELLGADRAILEGLHFELPVHVPGTQRRPIRRIAEDLTIRQNEVLTLVAEGQSNREIAQALGISERTVERHLTAIYTVLGVDRRSGAVALALGRRESNQDRN